MLHDLRYAIRTLFKTPGFAAVAVVTLALGIGANSAIFSVVNTVLFHALPYPEPERLVRVREKTKSFGYMSIAYPNFLDWSTQNKVFSSQCVVREESFTLTGTSEPERIKGVRVSNGLFATVGIHPSHGHGFLPEDDHKGAGRTVILSDGLWKRRFGGDPAAIGQAARLDGVSYSIIGVMPPEFRLPLIASDVLLPVGLDANTNRGDHSVDAAIARLKPGVSVAQAKSNLDAIARELARRYPGSNGGWELTTDGLQDSLAGEFRPAMLILFGAVGLVLLIACANVANLLLARSTARRREFAIRAALGAGRSRLARQSLVESLLLGLLGGCLGLLVASWGIDFLVSLKPADIPLAQAIRIDASVLRFTLAASIFTGLLFGLMPALESCRVALSETLKEGGRTSAGSWSRYGLRRTLVISEIALSLVLAVGAALLIKSFVNVAHVDPGFRAESVVTMRVSLPAATYSDNGKVTAFFTRLLENTGHISGMTAVGAVSNLPLANENWQTGFTVEGRPRAARAVDQEFTESALIAGDYFQAMGIPLRRGRFFNDGDKPGSPPVMIVDETMVKKYWPGEDPIGKRIFVMNDMRQVVGVVAHVKHYGLDRSARVESYFPFRQSPFEDLYIVVRTPVDPAAMSAAVRDQVHAMDKDLAVFNIRTMRTLVADSMATRRFSMMLLAVFAGLAVTLAAIGIYGVMAYTVAQRAHEMGIRMALGARAQDVRWLVVRQAMVLASIGAGAGLAVSLSATSVMSSLLFGVTATDPAVFAGVTTLMIGVALLASYMPARRATRVDPMVTLRCD
jgi:putative ABC transport system permease protein